MSNTFDKQAVLESFIEEVNSYLPDIETNLERLAHVPGDMDALEETYRRAHTIGGSASMMDFPGLAHVAHGMEDILGDALDGLVVADKVTLEILRRSLGRLRRLLEGIRGGIDEDPIIAEDDADYARYRSQVDGGSQSFQPSQSMPRLPGYEGQTQSPTLSQLSAQQAPSQPQSPGPEMSAPMQQEVLNPPTTPRYFETVEPPQPAASPSVPSLEEVLNSFRTPSVMPGDDLDWPEDPPAPSARVEEAAAPYWPSGTEQQPAAQDYWQSQTFQAPPEPLTQDYWQSQTFQAPPAPSWSSSALEELVASTRSSAPQQSQPLPQEQTTWEYTDPQSHEEQAYSHSSITPEAPIIPVVAEPASPAPLQVEPTFQMPQPKGTSDEANSLWNALNAIQPVQEAQPSQPLPPPPPTEPRVQADGDAFPVAYREAQQEAVALEEQAASWKEMAQQLRSAISIIEVQRGEFKGFLDGSKDALDRMEEWAGRAMGLNLRNSPEQVRRYLPLSVMWVANSKLKKVLDLLRQMTGGVEVTDEQFTLILQQLRASLDACGDVLRDAQDQASHVLREAPGWGAWQMQRNDENLRERVTFERQGDLETIRAQVRAEVEEQLRNEIAQEYASRPPSLAARAELEQQIRTEMHQELEMRRRLQESVGPEREDILHELEARLRGEIEIQVRQEFLSHLTSAGGDMAIALQKSPAGNPPAPLSQETITSTRQAPTLPPPRPASPPPMPKQAPSPSSLGDFGEEALEIFRTEAEEHLQTISKHVAALERDETNLELIQGVRRATHTLKGAAGMMGFRAIADLCHVSEDLLDSIMEGTTPINTPVLSIIFDTAEALDVLITGRSTDGLSEEARVQGLRERYTDLLGEQNVASIAVDDELEAVEEHLNARSMSSVVSEGEQDITVQAVRGDLSVHVRLSKLDELVNLFGELLVNRSVLEERLQRLMRLIADVSVSSNRLNDVGQKLESRFEAATLPSGRTVGFGDGGQAIIAAVNGSGNGTADKPYLSEFDELELDRYTEFHQLARSLSECISDMTTLSGEMDSTIRECEGIFARESRLSTTFQDRLMKARLVPLSAMTPRLYRSARSVALKQSKEIEFVTEGDTTEVDRTVFEEISGPLLHLIRNAVNHAIETPDIRVHKGKPIAGQIKLAASYEGNQIVITVSDDGQGIDREAVRRIAIGRNLIRPNQQLSESDVIELIFHPGFSTAEVLSEESGRGVGLDVVRDSVSRLRGKIVVESTPGQGTAFTMTFPTSLAIQNAMMIRVGGQQFAIPTVAVESIGRLDNFKRTTVGGNAAVIIQNDVYPLQPLAQYLSLTESVVDEKAQLLFINTSGQRVALIVEEIIGRSDIVMKNLGPHLRQVHGIAGGTILGNGHVVLILELSDLLTTRPRGSAQMPVPPNTSLRDSLQPMMQRQRVNVPQSQQTASLRPTVAAQTIPERGKHILVVDDSPSVRRVVSNMLKQHGWEVQTARDGEEALAMITYETPAAVLLDIEMPRMDGYELISTVRAQEQYRKLPLVVLTSRAAAKHQQRAMLLGASSYVVKPYQDDELINILNSLVYGAVVR